MIPEKIKIGSIIKVIYYNNYFNAFVGKGIVIGFIRKNILPSKKFLHRFGTWDNLDDIQIKMKWKRIICKMGKGKFIIPLHPIFTHIEILGKSK